MRIQTAAEVRADVCARVALLIGKYVAEARRYWKDYLGRRRLLAASENRRYALGLLARAREIKWCLSGAYSRAHNRRRLGRGPVHISQVLQGAAPTRRTP